MGGSTSIKGGGNSANDCTVNKAPGDVMLLTLTLSSSSSTESSEDYETSCLLQ